MSRIVVLDALALLRLYGCAKGIGAALLDGIKCEGRTITGFLDGGSPSRRR